MTITVLAADSKKTQSSAIPLATQGTQALALGKVMLDGIGCDTCLHLVSIPCCIGGRCLLAEVTSATPARSPRQDGKCNFGKDGGRYNEIEAMNDAYNRHISLR